MTDQVRVFISYSHQDRDFVDCLAEDLKASGVNVWLDKWEIQVGDSLTRRISEGIHEAGYLAVVLSPHSVRSEWVQRELNAGLVKELDLRRVFLLPILKQPCQIPAIIADKKWADFRERYDFGLQQLLSRFALEETILEPETVLIPEGEFTIGSEEGRSNERPLHPVVLPAYRIGRYPVTNRGYQAFIQDTGHASPYRWKDDRYSEGKGDHPVDSVSWHDAVAYCHWLSDQTGKSYRLPSEAEWEKAASWGPQAKNKRRYPWGDEFDSKRCNTAESEIGVTTPVRMYSPQGDSAYGVADMAGNVWEWCSTLYRDYPYNPQDGREDLEAKADRVLRGGSWLYFQRFARSAYRHRNSPVNRYYHAGFRVACSGSP